MTRKSCFASRNFSNIVAGIPRISSPFGLQPRPPQGGSTKHQGIDLAAPMQKHHGVRGSRCQVLYFSPMERKKTRPDTVIFDLHFWSRVQIKVWLFASVLLLPLLASASAIIEDGQEIGAPQMMESIANGCFGAVMSPDGKRLYILREGQLLQYQHNPFKKLGSIAVETAKVKAMKYNGGCTIGLTRNESKIIIVSQMVISLFDAQTGRLLKNVSADEQERAYSHILFRNSLEKRLAFNGDDLVIMFDTRIAVLDANTLAYKHKEIDIGKKCGFADDRHEKSFHYIAGRLFFISPQSVVVLNGGTYECELSAKLNERNGISTLLSRDFRTLALKGVTEFRDYRESTPARHDDMKKDDVLLFDMDARTASVKKDNVPFEGMGIYNLRPSTLREDGHSFFRLTHVNSKQSTPLMARMAIVDQRVKKFFAITTYEAGEAILMEAFLEFKFGNFQMTPGARKYLMMKNSEGKDVPMNDATFNKYYWTAFEN